MITVSCIITAVLLTAVYELSADEIESSGYVVDTLEAALWCLVNTNSYRECLLWAVNLVRMPIQLLPLPAVWQVCTMVMTVFRTNGWRV